MKRKVLDEVCIGRSLLLSANFLDRLIYSYAPMWLLKNINNGSILTTSKHRHIGFT